MNKQQRPLYPSGPRRSLDYGLGLAIPRAPWDSQNIPQIPFTDSKSPRLSPAEREALPALWAAQANHQNLTVHSPANHSARTPVSSTTQTWSTARTPLSSITPTWSTARTPISTITPATATTWSAHWSPKLSQTTVPETRIPASAPRAPETKLLGPRLRETRVPEIRLPQTRVICIAPPNTRQLENSTLYTTTIKTKSSPSLTTEKPLPTVPETPRLQWTPFFSPIGLPAGPRSGRHTLTPPSR